jgi:hypothetical protein
MSDWFFLNPNEQFFSYIMVICCFFAKRAALRSKSKDWLACNRDNIVSDWSDMSTHRRLFQCPSILKFQLNVLVQYKAVIIIISSNLICSHHNIAEKLLIWV